jgi:hypothetical protein
MQRDATRVRRAVDATVLAELFLRRPDGRLDAVTVTPLVQDRRIVVALTYAERELASHLDGSPVTLTLSDGRMALRGWEPMALPCRVEVEEDPDGVRFEADLLDQELRKHPPSRLLADSLRDRRDNWWFLPRLLCTLVFRGPVRELAARDDPTTGVLAWGGPDTLETASVQVVDAEEDRLELRPLSGTPLRGAGEPALLYRHDYSRPDLERRAWRHEAGRLEGAELREVTRSGDLTVPPPPRLMDRVRRHRALSKACRRELALLR